MKTIHYITKEELKYRIEQHDPIQVVNVLSPEHYSMGSIKNSIKIPLSELDDRAWELARTKEVVVYCASYECNASKKAAEKLSNLGYNVSCYEGGIKEWKSAGYPVE